MRAFGGFKRVGTGALMISVLAAPAMADRPSKDQGPVGSVCDRFEKTSAAFTACVGAPTAALSDHELFYAGYWLAKTGAYEKALAFLTRARTPDEKTLTYIGFATRKLGETDRAMTFYQQALTMNPNYAVARAYLGEAFLTKGNLEGARAELGEIERRCGRTCAEHADLARQISDFENGRFGRQG